MTHSCSILRRLAAILLAAAVLLALPAARAGTALPAVTAATTAAPVVLLHGLTRSPRSMERMAAALAEAGYAVCNVGYPSRSHPVEVLAAEHVAPAIARCFPQRTQPVHFVTHSMGGILVRQLAASGAVADIGRVVMLAPPNRGCAAVDKLGSLWLFKAITGPAGLELGTGADALPQRLGPAPFVLGVITGTRTFNVALSLLLPGEDDGKVSVAEAGLDGMADFLTVPVSHPFIMRHATVIEQTLHFLDSGRFDHRVAARQLLGPARRLAPLGTPRQS